MKAHTFGLCVILWAGGCSTDDNDASDTNLASELNCAELDSGDCGVPCKAFDGWYEADGGAQLEFLACQDGPDSCDGIDGYCLRRDGDGTVFWVPGGCIPDGWSIAMDECEEIRELARSVDDSESGLGACTDAMRKYNACLEGGGSGSKIISYSECSDDSNVFVEDEGHNAKFRTWSGEYLRCAPSPDSCLCEELGHWLQ